VHHDWPGNVRELRNAVQRILTLGIVDLGPTPQPVEVTSPGTASGGGLDYRAAREQALAQFERAYLERLMANSDGNVSAAARTAGVDRKYIRDLLKKHGLY
jgi:DNA-binding NtrC family response regulator